MVAFVYWNSNFKIMKESAYEENKSRLQDFFREDNSGVETVYFGVKPDEI